MSLTKLAVAFGLLMTGQASQDVVYTNLRTGRIPPIIRPERREEIREMLLFVSADKGHSWNQVDKITPDNREGFTYSTPADGEYWYQVVTIDKQGRQEPADPYKAPPLMKLVVDTKPPELKITSAVRQGEELVVSWAVTEDNPDPPQLKLDYRAADSTVWNAIPVNPSPQGSARARIGGGAGNYVVRLQFKDLANNFREVEAQVSGEATSVAFAPPAASAKTAPQPTVVATPAPAPSPVHAAPAPQEQCSFSSPVAMNITVPTTTGIAISPIATTCDPSQGCAVPSAGTTCAGPRRTMPRVQLVNDRDVVLEYELSKIGPAGLSEVEVWITRDGGQTWAPFMKDPNADKIPGGGKYSRTVSLPGDGVYGISLVVKSKAGIGRPAPKSGEIPEMLVEVDTLPPEAELLPIMPDAKQRDTVILSWKASDRNLGSDPVTLEWADQPTGQWNPIAANLPNSGRHAWRLPPALPPHVYLKLTVRDGAGNQAVAITREAQLVDMSEPEGHLVSVAPAKKHE